MKEYRVYGEAVVTVYKKVWANSAEEAAEIANGNYICLTEYVGDVIGCEDDSVELEAPLDDITFKGDDRYTEITNDDVTDAFYNADNCKICDWLYENDRDVLDEILKDECGKTYDEIASTDGIEAVSDVIYDADWRNIVKILCKDEDLAMRCYYELGLDE